MALGCSIISRPSILFLDEPTSGISPTSRRNFFKIIQRLAGEGATVMVTTHFMDEAERCYHIAFISEGSLIANDTPDNLKNNVIKGCLVELDLPGAMERIKEIESLPYVKECSIHGPASLGVGILISNIAKTQMQAFQMSFFFLLPSIMLSGFMFPREAMPLIIQYLSNLIPLTFYLTIIRGIVLKGIGFSYLVPQVAALLVFSVALLAISIARFKKKIA